MIARARQRVPKAVFRVGSFVEAELPPCVAVTAIGEVLGYAFDPSHSLNALKRVIQRVYVALAPKGILLFDLAGPAPAPAGPPQRSFVEGPDWAVLVEADADERKTILTRRMTTFRLHDEGYRRSHEVHYLRLMDPEDVTTLVLCHTLRFGFGL